MTLLVENAALMMTVQDSGRLGYQRFGLPESGPMDWIAHRAANTLVGNPVDAASIEIGFSSASLITESDTVLSACGAGYRLTVGGRALPLWFSFRVRTGERITLEKIDGGNWVYLAAAGGLLTPSRMGSRSTYARAGLGRRLAEGDRLPLALAPGGTLDLAGRAVDEVMRPAYGNGEGDLTLRVVMGPHLDRFAASSLETFQSETYYLSSNADRMGYRLQGPTLAHCEGADIVSQGMVCGEVQVPGDGASIVMMPDHPTTGGYTCIATVIRADLPLLAQAEPGRTPLRFEAVSAMDARAAYRDRLMMIAKDQETEEDRWLAMLNWI
ncbi:biotin-dependent carboxyltransferase family protein [bacterium]|nr:biotin-dependent carboxyltransferase family protein [bacterium]